MNCLYSQAGIFFFFFFLGDREGTAKKGAVEAKLGGG